MKALKYSRQRECIKQFLCSRTDHPTADAVYRGIRESCPNISLGTVYRNLSLLASLGEIQKIVCDGGADHFDAMIEPHYHVVCRRCGRVEDLPMIWEKDLDEQASHCYEGRIEGHSTCFYGLCGRCVEDTEKSQKQLDSLF